MSRPLCRVERFIGFVTTACLLMVTLVMSCLGSQSD
jgi:hypothetical protein